MPYSTQMAHRLVQQSRQNTLRAYCPNIYTVAAIEQTMQKRSFECSMTGCHWPFSDRLDWYKTQLSRRLLLAKSFTRFIKIRDLCLGSKIFKEILNIFNQLIACQNWDRFCRADKHFQKSDKNSMCRIVLDGFCLSKVA